MAKISSTLRDPSRRPEAKAASMRRKAQRREKSARAFLAFAFASPADYAAFKGGR